MICARIIFETVFPSIGGMLPVPLHWHKARSIHPPDFTAGEVGVFCSHIVVLNSISCNTTSSSFEKLSPFFLIIAISFVSHLRHTLRKPLPEDTPLSFTAFFWTEGISYLDFQC